MESTAPESRSSSLNVNVSSASPCVFIVKAIKVPSSPVITPLFSETWADHLSSKFTMNDTLRKDPDEVQMVRSQVAGGVAHCTVGLRTKVNGGAPIASRLEISNETEN